MNRCVITDRSQRMHRVRRDVHEVALTDLSGLALDFHDAATRGDVIELVRGVVMRVDVPAARDLELTHEFEMAALGDVEHLAWVDEPPDGHCPVVLDHGFDVFDRSNVHRCLLTWLRTLTTVAAYKLRLRLERVTHEAWAPFGSIPSDAGTEHDRADLEFLWNDGHANFIHHANDELRFADDGAAICELLNRHDTHTQTLMPFDTDGYVVVAPAGLDFSQPAHFDEIRAFRLPRHSVVQLARGTWHWGPYPVTADSIRIFNIQGTGYVHDNGIAWLARDLDAQVEVERD